VKKAVCFILSLAFLFLCGCSSAYEGDRIGKKGVGETDGNTLTENLKSGKDVYYDYVAKLVNDCDDNALFAPAPLYLALGMLMNGAAGDTLAEMENALGKTKTVNEFSLALRQKVAENAKKTQASIANSLWTRKDFTVKDAYLSEVSNYYAPDIFSVNFNDETAAKINKWVSDGTNGKIKKIVDGFDHEPAMLLLSALYIKGDWVNATDYTVTKNFTNADGTVSSAEFFGGNSKLYVSENAYGIKRFMDDGWFMAAILPKEGVNFSDYIDNFTGAELDAIFTQTDERGATYSFPEFENENDIMLGDVLKNMGMNSMFSVSLANFGALSDTGVYVDYVKQKAKIKVDKKGLEGAAVIEISMPTSAGPELNPLFLDFNRPFLYFVCTPDGLPVMLGTVTNL